MNSLRKWVAISNSTQIITNYELCRVKFVINHVFQEFVDGGMGWCMDAWKDR